jgi:hypothetical protein
MVSVMPNYDVSVPVPGRARTPRLSLNRLLQASSTRRRRTPLLQTP